jgi:hypothetical protein
MAKGKLAVIRTVETATKQHHECRRKIAMKSVRIGDGKSGETVGRTEDSF